jgi:hypothetical protein
MREKASFAGDGQLEQGNKQCRQKNHLPSSLDVGLGKSQSEKESRGQERF